MRMWTMRLVDKWLALPCCVVLTVARRLLDLGRHRTRPRPRRIVFIKLAEQGSTVLAYSAIRRAVDLVGRDQVFFVVLAENRFILDVLGLIPEDNVLTIRAHGLLVAFRDAVVALRRLRRLGVDTAIDLEFFARSSAALAYLGGPPLSHRRHEPGRLPRLRPRRPIPRRPHDSPPAVQSPPAYLADLPPHGGGARGSDGTPAHLRPPATRGRLPAAAIHRGSARDQHRPGTVASRRQRRRPSRPPEPQLLGPATAARVAGTAIRRTRPAPALARPAHPDRHDRLARRARPGRGARARRRRGPLHEHRRAHQPARAA